MSSNINKIRNLPDKVRIRPDGLTDRSSDLPLDHRLTFSPSPDEKWSFEGDQILLNGEDVNQIINELGEDIHSLNCISSGLDEYRQYVWQNHGVGFSKFNGRVNALLEKVLGRLGGIYDGIVGGVRFEYSEGDLWINNINLHKMLNLYRIRPTQKARCYLVGLRNKLALILSSQNGSAHYDGIMAEAERLFNEISCALDNIPPDDAHLCLPSAGSC